jgi:tetratricopeptide (TPR) repeat protein
MVAKSSELIEKYPQDADAYSDRGGAHFLLRRFDEALIDLNKAIELKPHFADAFNNRGVLYCAQGAYKQALHDLEAAISRTPTEAAYYLNRGTCYRMTGDHLHAGSDFDQALESDSSILHIADKLNRTRRILPQPHLYDKNEVRRLFFKANVVLVKYMGSNYSDVI